MVFVVFVQVVDFIITQTSQSKSKNKDLLFVFALGNIQPLQAIYKWFEIEPTIFKQTPQEFEAKLLKLQQKYNQFSSTTL